MEHPRGVFEPGNFVESSSTIRRPTPPPQVLVLLAGHGRSSTNSSKSQTRHPKSPNSEARPKTLSPEPLSHISQDPTLPRPCTDPFTPDIFRHSFGKCTV